MSRIDVDQATLLTAVITRLRSFLTLGERHCYAVARPQDAPGIPPGGDYWVTVAPGPGDFHWEEQGYGQCTEDTEITVTVYTRIKLDSTDHDGRLLLDDARGLMVLKRKLLQALSGHDLVIDVDANVCLRWILHARRADGPDIVKLGREGVHWGRIQIEFGVPFDWELTSE